MPAMGVAGKSTTEDTGANVSIALYQTSNELSAILDRLNCLDAGEQNPEMFHQEVLAVAEYSPVNLWRKINAIAAGRVRPAVPSYKSKATAPVLNTPARNPWFKFEGIASGRGVPADPDTKITAPVPGAKP